MRGLENVNGKFNKRNIEELKEWRIWGLAFSKILIHLQQGSQAFLEHYLQPGGESSSWSLTADKY